MYKIIAESIRKIISGIRELAEIDRGQASK